MTATLSVPLERLIAGYRRFRTDRWALNRERWAELREGQQPEVMIIACSDSRVHITQYQSIFPEMLPVEN